MPNWPEPIGIRYGKRLLARRPRTKHAFPLFLFMSALGKYWWALMSSAAFTFLSIYAAALNRTNKWTLRAIIAFAILFFLIAVYKAWKEQYDKVSESTPNFKLELNQALSHSQGGKTLVLVGMRIINRGASSIVGGYRVRYEGPDHSEEAQRLIVQGVGGEDTPITFRLPSGAVYSFRGSDAIYNRTSTTAIPRGDAVVGRLPVVVSGHRHEDIGSGRAKLIVTITDYLDREYTEEFRGTGDRPIPTYMMGEPISGENRAATAYTVGQAPTVRQPNRRERRRGKRKRS